MHLIVYIIAYPFLLLVSILPFRLLYMVSDLVYVLIFYVIGYRRKTVKSNLNLVFPEKSEQEIKAITKKFYRHMCDMFLEMIKSMSASKKSLLKRFAMINPEEFTRLEGLQKNVIVMYGHYASYEWSMVTENYFNFKGFGVYKKIKNKYFDALVRRIRSKYNTTLISTRDTYPKMVELTKQDVPFMIGFLSDQSPKLNDKNHWAEFMNIKVPTFVGAEVIAKKLDMAVSYLKIKKVKRGYYEAELVTLAENPKNFENFEVTDLFLRQLEDQIKDAPEYYLWTHKRWKHYDKAPKA
ncbi:lysophospholipid acyltransferase family protein [Winogradskyella sp. 3972H.M.0a.05]|uniref:lysophospholipid acyltransferase family protein n=1 Tax=Winogradskyella sp. 3972H.M.0a.05 TaxID=2950277 RepID=UPI003394C4F0